MADDVSDRAVTLSPGQQFGRRLREQREQQHVTLEAIAGSTKIKASLLAGLERGDISEWPAGIFQRAFVREYARAVGLAPEQVVAEFVRVFANGTTDENGAPGGLRLTLAFEPRPGTPPYGQVLVTLTEAASLLALAAVVSWVTPIGFAAVSGVFAFLYYAIATAFLGCSPATWYLQRDSAIHDVAAVPDRLVPAAADRRDRMYLVRPAVEPERALASGDAVDVDADPSVARSANALRA